MLQLVVMSEAVDESPDISYAVLLARPGVKRVVFSQAIGPLAQQAWTVAVILLMLDRFSSPALAGLAGFLSESGLILLALAGGAIEKHGARRFILADYLVSALVAVVLAGLTASDSLNRVTALILITIFGITSPLSILGLRTVLPATVPATLWDRANALTFVARAVSRLIGPVVAVLLSETSGPQWSLLFCGILYLFAAFVVAGFHESVASTNVETDSVKNALDGIRRTIQVPMLRYVSLFTAIGFIGGGALYGAMPALVKGSLSHSGAVIALAYFVFALTDIFAGLYSGRLNTANREWLMMAVTISLYGVGFLVMALDAAVAVVLGAAFLGIAETPLDQAAYGARQRASDKAWLAGTTAVALTVDFGAFAIGIAVTGLLAQWSPRGALVIAAAMCIGSAAIPLTRIRTLSR